MGYTSGPKYSAGWWFGKNSWWAQSGAKEYVTGAKPNGNKKGWFEGLGIKVEHDIPDEQKVILYGVIGLVLFKILMK